MSVALGRMGGMNFPLAELSRLADLLGGVVSGPLQGDAQLVLSDAELVGAVRSVEQLGRWADAVRLTLAGELGRRADAQFGDDRITKRFGGSDAADLLELRPVQTRCSTDDLAAAEQELVDAAVGDTPGQPP